MKSRTAQECHFVSHDGQSLFYRRWPALSADARGAIVLFHRGHEHSGRLSHLVHEMNLPDFDFFAWDARGHGRSPGARGFSPDVSTSLRDVQCFIDHIRREHGFSPEDMVVLGQSLGAVLAAGWVHDYAPPVRGMVLAAPAFKVKLYLPFATTALRLARRLKGDFFVRSYVKPRLLTQDSARVASYKRDPLIARPISVNMLLGIHELAERLIKDAAAITTPTQLLVSGSDWVVDQKPQHRFFEGLRSAQKERHVFEGFRHDTLGEKDRRLAIDKARDFIQRCFSRAFQQPRLLDADRQGPSYEEAARLARPLPAFSPAGLYWRLLRLGLKIGGWLSKGIGIGHAEGFDSGGMLDYVYENEPRGRTALGRALDRSYLNSIGWKGIRQRKEHVEELLGKAMARTQQANRPFRILDVAAGHGRYVLEAIDKSARRPQSIDLRDFSPTNVAAGKRLIAAKGLADIATFTRGDAFDKAALARTDPQPSIAIVSGLYELFAENAMVRDSLDGIAEALCDGGYLVYTGQPWHPQLELIARTLTSHRQGRPWVMRRRSQAEMDQLVSAAGFEKIDQRIDPWGIFTVSLARKKPA